MENANFFQVTSSIVIVVLILLLFLRIITQNLFLILFIVCLISLFVNYMYERSERYTNTRSTGMPPLEYNEKDYHVTRQAGLDNPTDLRGFTKKKIRPMCPFEHPTYPHHANPDDHPLNHQFANCYNSHIHGPL